MPELPEVETVRRVLEPQIRGHIIQSILVRRPEIIAYPAPDEFCRMLTGQTFEGTERRGKFLIMHLQGGSRLIVHLRMTGCLLLTPEDSPEEKYTHLVLKLENGLELRFSDMRRFGRFWLLREGEADTYSGMERLGKEPFDPDFSAEYLQAEAGRRRKPIKEWLLDQSVVAGIGNIYSDEILFTAGIHPLRPVGDLTGEEWERLAVLIPERLSYFIEKNTITPEEYLETKGQDYRNTPYLQVYGQEGAPCPVCATKLCRRKIGGRSSVFCPACQILHEIK